MGSVKENAIREYLQTIDFKSEDWSVSDMQSDMRVFLGEAPGIDINYQKDVLINEGEGTSKEYKRVDKVAIVFTDLDEKFKKIEILVD